MAGRSDVGITELLRAATPGDDAARDRLWGAVYDEVRDMAQRLMRREPPGHVLQATALVNEAYARLPAVDKLGKQSRAYFFGAVGRAMRRILIEHARKAGYRRERNPTAAFLLENLADVKEPVVDERLDALAHALDRLERYDRRTFDVVMLRFFAGLTVPETAHLLGMGERTVKRDWQSGRAWLYQQVADTCL